MGDFMPAAGVVSIQNAVGRGKNTNTCPPGPATRSKGCTLTKNSAFLDSFLFSSANLFFGLEPVVELRAGLIASLNVQFMGSPPDFFLTRQRLDWRFLSTCGCGHGITSGDDGSIIGDGAKGRA